MKTSIEKGYLIDEKPLHCYSCHRVTEWNQDICELLQIFLFINEISCSRWKLLQNISVMNNFRNFFHDKIKWNSI